MNLKAKVDKIESQLGSSYRCASCAREAEQVVIDKGDPLPQPCPACGWTPEVIEVEETVVNAG